MVNLMLSRVLPATLCIVALSGCPGSVSTDGVDDFTVNSAQWMVYAIGGTQSHELVVTSVSGYCAKRKSAEADRQAANERYEQALADGMSLCEALDQRYDDMAAAFNPLEKAGASYLRATLARDVDSSDLDAITAPAAGHYAQIGAGSDGGFSASIQHHQARYNQQVADAFSCDELDAEEMDDAVLIAQLGASSLAEAEPPEVFAVSAGEMDITEPSSTKREVHINGDILEGGTTIGGIDATFTATKCEVELATELSF